MPRNEMLDEMLDQVVKRIQHSIQYSETKFAFDLDQTSSNINRPFSYSTKEPGSSVIFIHFYTRGSIEWR